jgi:hypothetical protein
MPLLSFAVRGHKPQAYSTYETQWKAQIAVAARQAAGAQSVSLPATTCPMRVHAIFYIVEPWLMRTDLDNLAKPLMDALFRPGLADVSAPFPFEDCCVTRLSLEKHRAGDPSQQGCEVRIEW